MLLFMKFLHLIAAIVWLGGISFLLFSLRPIASNVLPPPLRLPLMAQSMQRFFGIAWACVLVLLMSGLVMLLAVGMKNAPAGWHAMLGIGLLMFAVFGHLYFGPFRRLKQAITAANWPEGGRRAGQIAMLAYLNLFLGGLAIAAVFFLV